MPSTRIILNGPVFLVSDERGGESLNAAITKFIRTHRVRSRPAASELDTDGSDEDFASDASEDTVSSAGDDSDADAFLERYPTPSRDGAVPRRNDAPSRLAPIPAPVAQVNTPLFFKSNS